METLVNSIEQAIAELEFSMNDVSVDFACNYSLDSFDGLDLQDLIWEYADGATPVYDSDIDDKCTNKMIDAYLNETGSVTISDSSDINKIKQAALCHDYERQLFEDEREILTVIFFRAILEEPDAFASCDIEDLKAAVEDAVHECLDGNTHGLDELKASLGIDDEEE